MRRVMVCETDAQVYIFGRCPRGARSPRVGGLGGRRRKGRCDPQRRHKQAELHGKLRVF